MIQKLAYLLTNHTNLSRDIRCGDLHGGSPPHDVRPAGLMVPVLVNH